jgi:hypothetical protein
MILFWEGLEDVSPDKGQLLEFAYEPKFVSLIFYNLTDRSASLYSLSIA